jgi:hypothetical protein
MYAAKYICQARKFAYRVLNNFMDYPAVMSLHPATWMASILFSFCNCRFHPPRSREGANPSHNIVVVIKLRMKLAICNNKWGNKNWLENPLR